MTVTKACIEIHGVSHDSIRMIEWETDVKIAHWTDGETIRTFLVADTFEEMDDALDFIERELESPAEEIMKHVSHALRDWNAKVKIAHRGNENIATKNLVVKAFTAQGAKEKATYRVGRELRDLGINGDYTLGCEVE